MVDKRRVAGEVMWRVYTLAGFRVNFGVTKTAVKIRWAGFGVAIAKGKLEQLESGKIWLRLGELQSFLPGTRPYKHMGTRGSDTGTMGPEIAHRCLSTSTALKPIRRKVLRNPDVKQTSKTHILTVALMSKDTHHMGCWPALLAGEYRLVKSGLLRLYRLLVPASSTC